MGRWAKKNWNGEVEEILLIELLRAGSLPKRGCAAGRGHRRGATAAGGVPYGFDRRRRQFQTCLERCAKPEGIQVEAHLWAPQRSERSGRLRAFEEAGRAPEWPSWTEWRTGGPRRTAHAEHAADRVSGLFPGEVRRRSAAPGAGHPGRKAVPPAMFTTHRSSRRKTSTLLPQDSLLAAPG